MSLIIINCYYSQLNKSIVFCLCEAFDISLYAIYVEVMSPEEIHIQIHLMFTFTINTLECMRIRLFFLGFQLRWVDFVIHFAVLSKLPMML